MAVNSFQLRRLAPLLALVLFGAALWVLHHALAEYRYHDILRQLQAIPTGRVGMALALTALSYLVMTAYDRLAVAYIRHPLDRGKVTLASFISYAFSNNIGLSLLTSGSIRYRLYSAWGRKWVLLIGYSLGADVMPFLAGRLPEDLRQQVAAVTLLGPGRTASFEGGGHHFGGSYDKLAELIFAEAMAR